MLPGLENLIMLTVREPWWDMLCDRYWLTLKLGDIEHIYWNNWRYFSNIQMTAFCNITNYATEVLLTRLT
jgi:hypothetical protein